MPGFSIVEASTNEHMHDLAQLGKMLHSERGASYLDFDPDCVTQSFNALCRDLDREYLNVFIGYEGVNPIGFIVCRCYPYFFSKQRMSQQELWYVIPERRGSSMAFKLMKAYEEWARLRGAVEIWTGTAIGTISAQKRTGRALKRFGYALQGMYYTKVTVKG